MTDLVLDPARSRVRVHTFAQGLLARLAHDLELVCGDLSGTASRSDEGGGASGTASIAAPLRAISVAGVLDKQGRLDERKLSPSERKECLTKMQHEVFHTGPEGVVRVEIRLDGSSARVRVVPPKGKQIEVVVRPDVRAEADAVRATGSFEVSLAAIGADTIKAPMNAFRVKDRVSVLFDVVFAPAAQPA